MKNYAPLTILILFVLSTCFVSCKKDALEVKDTMHYNSINPDPNDVYGIFSQILILRPNGQAEYSGGGDVTYKSVYKVKGKKIFLERPADPKISTYFTIISENELRTEGGITLILSKGSK
jgi:hypothetical protein